MTHCSPRPRSMGCLEVKIAECVESSGLSCGHQDEAWSSLTGRMTGHVITSGEHFRAEGQTGRTKADWATSSEPLLLLLANTALRWRFLSLPFFCLPQSQLSEDSSRH